MRMTNDPLGQVEQAIEDYYKKALTIARETRDRRNEGIWLDHMGFAYCALRQFEQAIKLHKEAIAIACKIGNRLGKSYSLLGLGLALLAIGDLSQARQSCQKARDLNLPATSFRAALGLGIVFLHQHDAAAKETFADAASRCCAMLGKTAGLYEPCYVLAAALVGQAACDPHWAEGSKRDELLAPAMAEYRRALEICVAPGVVQDALRDLEMIRAAGIEGLEPVFELLKGAKARHEH
jgi:tetratricopeptide (TPR) repeat protein